jgi:hypothetical protein
MDNTLRPTFPAEDESGHRTRTIAGAIEWSATPSRSTRPITRELRTKSTVQWRLHRRMRHSQPMRQSLSGAHLMLEVRTSVVNGTFNKDVAAAERWARRAFRKVA